MKNSNTLCYSKQDYIVLYSGNRDNINVVTEPSGSAKLR